MLWLLSLFGSQGLEPLARDEVDESSLDDLYNATEDSPLG